MNQFSKKILVFSLHFKPFIGGAEIALEETVKRLPQYQFHIVTLRKHRELPKIEKNKNLTIHRVGLTSGKPVSQKYSFGLSINKYFFPLVAFKYALKLQKKENLSIVWSIMAAHASLGAVLFRRFYPNIPHILTLQEGIPKEDILRQGKRAGILFREIFRKADRVVAISNYLANFGKEMGAQRIVVIPNGVDVEHFSCHPTRDNHSGLRLITVSRLDHKNGVADIIKALPQLIGVTLDIVGDGPLHNDLKKLAQEKGVHDRVHFKGAVSFDDVPKNLCQADIFIRPSYSEGLGTAFLEAMSCGLPIIGTPVGGIVDFLKDVRVDRKKGTGLLVTPGSSQEIIQAVQFLKKNPELQKDLSLGGRRLIEEKYTWDKVVSKMESEVFEKL